ncbi:CDP-alcohol phosphatidyltransferase family protein [Pedomonas sp. V897]|uniref:CDP-alcohol phosphatidyltransferase family protein n=1 Tax=Pedomonas sp. V897 TaxID=3446482 RepID=UPI003EE0525A
MTLPNILCVLRLLAAPIVAALIYKGEATLAATLFAVSAITDAVDGYLARRWRQISVLGQMLDPLADKALINLSYIAAAAAGPLPWWLALLVLARDVIILAGALLSRALHLGHDLLPLAIGKISTALQMILMVVTLGSGILGVNTFAIPEALIVAVTVVTIASGVLYAGSWLLHLVARRQPAP